jgi:hypothetical protein
MRIFATKFTDISRSYYADSCTDRAVDLVVALREGYPECFCVYTLSLFYPILNIPQNH